MADGRRSGLHSAHVDVPHMLLHVDMHVTQEELLSSGMHNAVRTEMLQHVACRKTHERSTNRRRLRSRRRCIGDKSACQGPGRGAASGAGACAHASHAASSSATAPSKPCSCSHSDQHPDPIQGYSVCHAHTCDAGRSSRTLRPSHAASLHPAKQAAPCKSSCPPADSAWRPCSRIRHSCP